MSLALSTQFDNFRALGNVEKSRGDLHLSSKGTNIERIRSCEKVKIALMHSIYTQTAKTVCKLCKVICMIVSVGNSAFYEKLVYTVLLKKKKKKENLRI